MLLSPAQEALLATDILTTNQAEFAARVAATDDPGLAAAYNALASPTVTLWRPNITKAEMHSAVVWSDFVGLTAIRQNGYLAMMTGADLIDATKANIRLGFAAIFGAGSATLTALTALGQQPATRLEALLSAQDGAARTSAVFGVRLGYLDIAHALRGVTL